MTVAVKLHRLPGGLQIVVVDRPEKRIVCFPVSIGCRHRCRFCAAAGSFKRDLSGQEVIDAIAPYASADRPVLLSAMGPSEPLDNIRVLSDVASAFPDVRLAMSTVGHKTIDVPERYKVQLSLHFTNNYFRQHFMPGVRRIETTLNELPAGSDVAYTLIAGINDSIYDASYVSDLLKGKQLNLKLYKFNDVRSLRASPEYMAQMFKAALQVPYEWYETDGVKEGAACGLLSIR